MAILSRIAVVATCLGVVSGVRTRRQTKGAKFIAGVPVFNYHLAYGELSSAVEINGDIEQDWMVGVHMGSSDAEIKALCASAKCKMTGHPEKGGSSLFEIRSSEAELESLIRKAGGKVKYAEPAISFDFKPEDLETAGSEFQATSTLWGLDRIGVADAPNTGAGVHIYVVDSGVRASHISFGGRVVPTVDMSSGELVLCNGNESCADDKVGHGTHCAGSAGADKYGVAPGATIHAVKVLGDYGLNPWDWTYEAMDWLALNYESPAVVSMSMGSPPVLTAMQDSLEAVVSAGVTVVVAAGNSNGNACNQSPAFIANAITVGSIDRGDKKSSFSNYGSCVNIWAPGGSITSLDAGSSRGTKTLSGTSMSTPHVSGGAAIILADNQDFTPAQIMEALLAGAVDNGISGLTPNDANKLLFVGADGPPPTPAPVPTPAPLLTGCKWFGTGPDADGDCRCKTGSCYMDGKSGCTCRNTIKYGSRYTCRTYFRPDCENCVCE